MNKELKQTVDIQRRDFVRGTLSTSVAVAVAASVPVNAIGAEEEQVTEIKKQQGYHLTNHILEYYKSAAS